MKTNPVDILNFFDDYPRDWSGFGLTFIHLDDRIKRFNGHQASMLPFWWYGTLHEISRPQKGRIIMLAAQETSEFDVVKKRNVEEISMGIFQNDRFTPLTNEQSRRAYLTDPKTGKQLPPETHLRFIDFKRE